MVIAASYVGHHMPCLMPITSPRSQGGLGIEQNVVTLCLDCHTRYDNGAGREQTKAEIKAYLEHCYPQWDESALIFKK